jgi:hypothetical protein
MVRRRKKWKISSLPDFMRRLAENEVAEIDALPVRKGDAKRSNSAPKV